MRLPHPVGVRGVCLLLRGDRRSREITRYDFGVAQCADRDIVHLQPLGEHLPPCWPSSGAGATAGVSPPKRTGQPLMT